MAFMELFTEYGQWLVLDGPFGGEVIPADLVSDPRSLVEYHETAAAITGMTRQPIPDELADYTENEFIYSLELVTGWCARYSAPGYMDRTDWCGPYATEEEAIEECRAVHGDDEDEDEEDEEEDETAP